MTDAIDRFDDAADALVDRVRGRPGLDPLFYAASAAGEFGTAWLVIGAVGFARTGDRRRFARLALAMGAESVLVNGGVKSLFKRRRPIPHFERPLPLRIPVTSSFPSGHASNAVAAATILSDGEPRRAVRAAYWSLAAVIATSRVYVKIHHVSDVIGGAVVGRLYGLAVTKLVPLRSNADDT